MSKLFIKDITAGNLFNSSFILKSMVVRQKKNGGDFLSLSLGDKSGEISAVLWDGVSEAIRTLSEGDYVKVSGKASSYNDNLQITAEYIKKLLEEDIDKADYITITEQDVPVMWEELLGIIKSIKNPHLNKLLLEMFEDDEFRKSFTIAPAATGNHHACKGGLLDHTLSVAKLCEFVADHYPLVDRDLLLTGGILHDYAKTRELTYNGSLGYSDAGRLLGHMVIGSIDLDHRMTELDFPRELSLKLLHMVVSHHGKLEFGSPCKPMIPEAAALHLVDMLDSRIEVFRMAIEKDKNNKGSFTTWNRTLESFIYKK